MKYAIYYIINLINGKIYVGATGDPKQRWSTHKNIAIKGKEKFPKHFQAIHAAIKKYGIENFSYEIIELFDDEIACYISEIEHIKNIKQTVGIYNISGGGKGTGSKENHPMYGKKLPEEWINNIRIAMQEHVNDPSYEIIREGHRQRMIDRNWIGENHPMYGKLNSEETRKKISEKGIGRIFTEEHKENLSNSLTGRKFTDEHILNIKKSKKGTQSGNNNPNVKILTEEYYKILKLHNEGLSNKKIAVIFNVSKTTISYILKKIRDNNISYLHE